MFQHLNYGKAPPWLTMKVQCFLSLKIPVKPNQYWGTTAVFNASIIMIKIMNRPISRLYYFHNTNQISSIAIFYLYYFHKKDPKSHSSVRVFFLRTVLDSSLPVQVKNISERRSRSCEKKSKEIIFYLPLEF